MAKMTKEDVLGKIGRKATVFEPGSSDSSENIRVSWIGKVMVAEEGETWPLSNGTPMIPLCQLNLTDLPFKPFNLEDIEFITVFIDGEDFPCNYEPNGEKWCLRAYKSVDKLVPLNCPEIECYTKLLPFQLKPGLIENDCPSVKDPALKIQEGFEKQYEEDFKTAGGIKIGGWPLLIQSGLFWGPEKPAYIKTFICSPDRLCK